jgi:hypothetical protein
LNMLITMRESYFGRFIQVLLASLYLIASTAAAEEPADFSDPELIELVGPIALYPDDLVAILLPAAAYPLQIVQANRFLGDIETNPELKSDDSWDPTVIALLNYPEAVKFLNDDIDWTYSLGLAFINQEPGVLDAIQGFRTQALEAGNLLSDEYQVVSIDNGSITIALRNPDELYVPYYQPSEVVVRHVSPVYHYYGVARPVYYYPYPVHHSFAAGYFWGVSTYFNIGWHHSAFYLRHHGHYRHPYYGYSYAPRNYYVRGYVRHDPIARRIHARHHREIFRRHSARNYHHYSQPRHGDAYRPHTGRSYAQNRGNNRNHDERVTRHDGVTTQSRTQPVRFTQARSPQRNEQRSSTRRVTRKSNHQVRNRTASNTTARSRTQPVRFTQARSQQRNVQRTSPRRVTRKSSHPVRNSATPRLAANTITPQQASTRQRTANTRTTRRDATAKQPRLQAANYTQAKSKQRNSGRTTTRRATTSNNRQARNAAKPRVAASSATQGNVRPKSRTAKPRATQRSTSRRHAPATAKRTNTKPRVATTNPPQSRTNTKSPTAKKQHNTTQGKAGKNSDAGRPARNNRRSSNSSN